MKTIVIILLCLSIQVTIASQLPTGFAEQLIAQNLDPTDLVITQEGRIFITIKSGKILIVENGVLLPTPLLDITTAVDNDNERGLGHIVLDPNFEFNNYYYIYYTVLGSNYNRISRFTANGNSTLPGSEVILMNLDDLFSSIHNAGDMAFGLDGKLYVSVGESGNPANAQVMTNVLGKILRINSDGTIPTDNPFYSTATGKNRAIYALGFRNPFSMDIQPGTGEIFVSDVGQAGWEEINEVHAGGNYGWPGIEGVRTNQTPPEHYHDPVHAYPHSEGCAIVGAAFYNPANVVFPAQYVGKFYYADYCNGYIKYLDPTTSAVQTFATGINRPLAIVTAPDGSLYYLARAGIGGGSQEDNTSTTDGTLWRVTYSGSGAPTVSAQPQSLTAVVGDQVNFVIAASGTEPFSYQWMIDDVPVDGANATTFSFDVTQLSDNGKSFTCEISNALGSVVSNAAILTVANNSRPVPQITITLPGGGSLYQAGQLLQFSGGATDAEDGVLPASALTWKVDFHHNVHSHPGLPATSGIASGSYSIPQLGETSDDVWYRVTLTATDNDGFSKTIYQDVFPQKVEITLHTSPANLTLLLDGQTIQTPYTFTSVVGVTRSLEAPVTQSPGGVLHTYTFWTNQSLARQFIFNTPQTAENFTAVYQVFLVGSGDGLKAEYRNISNTYDVANDGFVNPVVLSRIDPSVNFDWSFFSPSNGVINPDYFTARWTGEIQPQLSETYQFYVTSDDGVRLWVDNVLLIDKWQLQGPTEWSGSIRLEAGQRYRIRLEYLELEGGSSVKLEWSSLSTARQVVPQTQLYSIPVPRRMVAIGSSTTFGTGTSPLDSSWVNRFNHYYKNQLGVVDATHNLGLGGTNPYQGMPTSYVNVIRPGQNPDPARNVTKANSLLKSLSVPSNGVVIVNYPSNLYDVMSVQEVIDALQIIYDSATRTGNKCYITTTQPRQDYPFFQQSLKKKMALIKDAIIETFGVDHTINFWDGLYNPADTTILPIYSAGDNIHLNNAGHKVLFERVVAKDVFNLSLPTAGDYRSNVASSGNWSSPSTWQIGNGSTWQTATTPPGSSNKLITIKEGNTINVDGNVSVNGSVMIRSSGTLSAGANNINLKGNWTNNGSFLAGTGTVTFDGTTRQSMDGSSVTNFHNLSVVNTTGVQVQSDQNLTGVLTLGTNAKFDADGSNNNAVFTLVSTGDNPTQDAAIAALPSGAVVNGNVTVQRFMSMEGVNSSLYRYISSPVQDGTVADIQNEIPVTGPFGGSDGPYQSMFYYNEVITTDVNGSGTADLNDGYVDFPRADEDNTKLLGVGQGYVVYIYGDLISSAKWDVRGTISQGNFQSISFPVTFQPTNNLDPLANVDNDGWNLIGNPFPSTIHWEAPGWTKENIDASIYFRDNGATPPRFESWNGVVGTNGTTPYIATGQAFWVKANGLGTPVIFANENVKAPVVSTTFFREGDPPNIIRIRMAKGWEEDEAVIHFRKDATPAFDSHADAWKLLNGSFNLSSMSGDSRKLSINSWSPVDCEEEVIQLSMDHATMGNYELKISGSQSFENAVAVLLVDNFSGETITVDHDLTYSFTVTSDVNSTSSDRFLLRVSRESDPIAIVNLGGKLSIGASGNIQWYFNENPIDGANSTTLQPSEPGVYSVMVDNGDCPRRGSYEFLVTDIENARESKLNIYPNPTDDEFFIRVENTQPVSEAFISNALGEKLGVINLSFSDGTSAGKFSLRNRASGMYIVKCLIGQRIVTSKVIKK